MAAMATTIGAHENGAIPYSYSSTQQGYRSPHVSAWYKVFGAVVITLGLIALLAKLLRFWLRSLKDAAAAADHRARRAPLPSDADRRRQVPLVVLLDDAGSSGGSRDQDNRAVVVPSPSPQPPAPAAVAVEMVREMGPLVCTYLRADGWPAEAACAVCLAELADGEALRVLPVCMHYFHAPCVGEWLRAHDTCPLCRAPLAPPPGAADDAHAAV